MDVPQARRLERASWMNGRTLLGLLISAAALFGGQRVMQNAENTVTVWTAARDVPGEEVIDRTHLRVAEVRLPSDLLASTRWGIDSSRGDVATRPIAAGELFSTVWIVDGTELDSGRVISIPLQPEHAVGGTLSPGDRIDILATFDVGEAWARTVVLAQAVEVREVVRAEGLIDDPGQIGVTVSVDAAQSARLAVVIRNAEIDVVRVTGAPEASSAGTVTGADLP